MRWLSKPRPAANIRSGFLFLPKTINGETRWMERASWEVEFRMTMVSGRPYWASIRWVDGGVA